MTQPYQLTADTTTILRVSDGAQIPADPLNSDYQVYLGWVEQGGVPDPYVAPPVVAPPAPTLSDLQAQLAALTTQINAAIAGQS